MRVIYGLHVFLLFVSFLLLLLVTLSLTIIKSIYLLQVSSVLNPAQPLTSIASTLRFGIWGFCATSELNEPGVFTNGGACSSPPKLGYNADAELLALTGAPEVVEVALKVLFVVLVLHPITAGLSFLSLLLALPSVRSHCAGILALIVGIVTALLGTVVMAVDFALVVELRQRLDSLTGGDFDVRFGNAVWMMLVAVVLAWAGVVLGSVVVCDCCGRRSREEMYGPANDVKKRP